MDSPGQAATSITRKAEWPDWRPPLAMIEREAKRNHFIPALMKGGANNPLGARALYIGDTEFRIHGTTQPWSIGRAVSSGCIRLLNEDVIDLYERVKVGAVGRRRIILHGLVEDDHAFNSPLT